MNYIYDIYLNLNELLYDFFDWNKNDKLVHIKKIPIIRIKESVLKEFAGNKILINEDLFFKIENKSEIWNCNNKFKSLILFCDLNTVIAIEFNNEGKSIKKSYLSVDEELEILEMVPSLPEMVIEYKITKKEKNIMKTRKQLLDDKFIYNEIKNMNEEKLNYIYFECFGVHEKSKKKILDKINNISKSSIIYKNLYDILKFTSAKNK